MPGDLDNPIAEGAKRARARAAERMRRSRARRRDRLRCCVIQLRDREIDVLIRLGLLSSAERANHQSVIKALHAFLDETLGKVQ